MRLSKLLFQEAKGGKMRRIKVGDNVKAFLNPNFRGKVVEILYEPPPGGMLLSEGVPSTVTYAVVKLPDGRLMKSIISDLFIEF